MICLIATKVHVIGEFQPKLKEEQQEEKQVDDYFYFVWFFISHSWLSKHSVFVHSGIFFLARYDLFFCFDYGWHFQSCFGVPGFELTDFNGSLRCYLSHLLFCISKGGPLEVGQGTGFFYWCFFLSTLEVALFMILPGCILL